MDDLSRRAVAAALAVSRNLGLCCSDAPQIIADGSNVLVHLVPARVVARVATTTALVRKPAQRSLGLDLDLAGYLAAQGFPVVPPSWELPPGPHLHDGFALTFWEFVEHDRNYVAGAQQIGPLLRELHAVLRGYHGLLRRLSPFIEIPQWLDEVASWNNDEVESWGTAALNGIDDIAMLRRGLAAIAAEIDALKLPEQPLHGDAHKKMSSRLATPSSGPTLKTPVSAPSRGTSPPSSAPPTSPPTLPSPATAPRSIQPTSTRFSQPAIFRVPRGASSSPRAFPIAKNVPPSGWQSPVPDTVRAPPQTACLYPFQIPALSLGHIFHIQPAYPHLHGSYDGAGQRFSRQ